jgi:hypothetical protein
MVRRISRDRPKKKPVALRGRSDTSRISSPTGAVVESLLTGLPPAHRRPDPLPKEGETIRVGDPDDSSLLNEYAGEDTPGGSSPTPDQNDVDEIGRAYGLQEEDSGALRSGEEVLSRRDRRRNELQPPGRKGP